MSQLTFDELRKANLQRCPEFTHNDQLSHPNGVIDWDPFRWFAAVAGETGELGGVLKEHARGGVLDKDKIANEIGDVIAYLDLLAARCEIDMGDAVASKFNAVSERVGSSVRLGDD